jgi:hypothetical protein
MTNERDPDLTEETRLGITDGFVRENCAAIDKGKGKMRNVTVTMRVPALWLKRDFMEQVGDALYERKTPVRITKVTMNRTKLSHSPKDDEVRKNGYEFDDRGRIQ